jgi:phenylacetate-CoA ligase
MLPEIIFKLGAHFRNPGLFTQINALLENDMAPRNSRMAYQEQRLADLLQHMKNHSPYYGSLINLDIPAREALAALPIVDKAFLVQNIDQLNCYKQFEKLIEVETSGTSGLSFKFKKNVLWDTNNRAAWMRNYAWYGVNPWDKNGYFWGYNIQGKSRYKTMALDILQNRFRVFNYDDEAIKNFLVKLKSSVFLHGYSSMIYEVAKVGEKLGFLPTDFPKLKMIKGTSEKIYPHYHDVVMRVFGQKIISEYGAAETGIIAYECPQGNMHVNDENVIVEVIDGEAVVTNLNAYSLPIIRYKLGDAITMDDITQCTCGRKSAIISEVHGRVGKVIRGKAKSFPSLTLYYVFKNLALDHGIMLQYQGVQTEVGRIILKIVEELSSSQKTLLQNELEKYFGQDLEVEITDKEHIHDKSGKLTDFKTSLKDE